MNQAMSASSQPTPPARSSVKTTIKLAFLLSAALILAWLLYLFLTPAPVLPPPVQPAAQIPGPPPAGDQVR